MTVTSQRAARNSRSRATRRPIRQRSNSSRTSSSSRRNPPLDVDNVQRGDGGRSLVGRLRSCPRRRDRPVLQPRASAPSVWPRGLVRRIGREAHRAAVHVHAPPPDSRHVARPNRDGRRHLSRRRGVFLQLVGSACRGLSFPAAAPWDSVGRTAAHSADAVWRVNRLRHPSAGRTDHRRRARRSGDPKAQLARVARLCLDAGEERRTS